MSTSSAQFVRPEAPLLFKLVGRVVSLVNVQVIQIDDSRADVVLGPSPNPRARPFRFSPGDLQPEAEPLGSARRPWGTREDKSLVSEVLHRVEARARDSPTRSNTCILHDAPEDACCRIQYLAPCAACRPGSVEILQGQQTGPSLEQGPPLEVEVAVRLPLRLCWGARFWNERVADGRAKCPQNRSRLVVCAEASVITLAHDGRLPRGRCIRRCALLALWLGGGGRRISGGGGELRFGNFVRHDRDFPRGSRRRIRLHVVWAVRQGSRIRGEIGVQVVPVARILPPPRHELAKDATKAMLRAAIRVTVLVLEDEVANLEVREDPRGSLVFVWHFGLAFGAAILVLRRALRLLGLELLLRIGHGEELQDAVFRQAVLHARYCSLHFLVRGAGSLPWSPQGLRHRFKCGDQIRSPVLRIAIIISGVGWVQDLLHCALSRALQASEDPLAAAKRRFRVSQRVTEPRHRFCAALSRDRERLDLCTEARRTPANAQHDARLRLFNRDPKYRERNLGKFEPPVDQLHICVAYCPALPVQLCRAGRF
eukprot:scaffold1461_cov253-Pinguiococcus_pyrenoidosus.AAC.27